MTVIQLPLPARRDRIAALLRRDVHNREEWAEIKLGLVREIGSARAEFQNDDNAFGTWIKTSGFAAQISNHDRAAYVSMARDIDLAKQILLATQSRSIELINRHEFRPMFESKQGVCERSHTPQPRKLPKAKQRDKAREAIETLKAQGKPVTDYAVASQAGVGTGTANKAMAEVLAEEAATAETTAHVTQTLTEDQLLAHAEATLSFKGKMSIQKTLAILKKRQEKMFWTAVGEEVRRQIAKADDAVRKGYNELQPAHMRLEARYAELQRQKGVFTRKEFRQLQTCVHPDNTASIDVRNRILDILVKNEKRLVIPD